MELLHSPFEPHFRRLLDAGETRYLICSPYLSRAPICSLAEGLVSRHGQDALAIRVVTDLSARSLLGGSTDITALTALTELVPSAEVVYVPRVHAKVYIAGESLAVVGSANLTESGSRGNLEYGVAIRDPEAVGTIRRDVERYAALGGAVSAASLQSLSERVRDLREALKTAQASANESLREAAAKLEEKTQDELVRLHVAGRTPHAVFAQTLQYLLAIRPMGTRELHEEIRALHPDLCDDTVDRVIDGRHYGKRWKHHVRSAQAHLKARGVVARDDATGVWRLV